MITTSQEYRMSVIDQLVTVTIPASRVEPLSSRERSRGKTARRGWWRHVTSCDRTARGGYALIGPQPFLPTGEVLLPVGAVVVECHWDLDVRVLVVIPEAPGRGRLITIRDAVTGDWVWTDVRTATITLCDRVEAAMRLSTREVLELSASGAAIVAARTGKDADVTMATEAAARLAAYAPMATLAPSLDREVLDEARTAAIARIRREMSDLGITVADLA